MDRLIALRCKAGADIVMISSIETSLKIVFEAFSLPWFENIKLPTTGTGAVTIS